MSVERKLRRGWRRSRPIRAAFLVADGEHAHRTLDGIFAESYRRWGGRFSLVVPCIGDRVPAGYWPWLEAYDPDIVYSYVPLTDDDVLELHERLNLSVYKRHDHYDPPRLDVHGFMPRYDTSPLSSLSTIFRLARHQRKSDANGPLAVIDCWLGDHVSQSFADSFGTYQTSFGTSMYPNDALHAAHLLTIISPEKLKGKYGVRRDLISVPDETSAIIELAQRRAISLSIASTHFAPKLDMTMHRWGRSFQLVIGDGFADRLMFWNGRLLTPNWLHGGLCGLRVSPSQLEDQAYIAALVELINAHNHVNDGGGGQTALTVRSASLSAVELEAFAARLKANGCWCLVQSQHVTSIDEMLPTEQDLQNAAYGLRFAGDFTFRSDWTEFHWEGNVARPPTTVPDHLLDAPPKQYFVVGTWATEFRLEHDEPKPHFSESGLWVFPRRWRMAGAFKATFADVGRDYGFPARRCREGTLTLFERIERPIQAIDIPAAYDAIRHALVEEGRWASRLRQDGTAIPASRTAWMSLSNEARYLNGVLGMCGGLRPAQRFLLHPFMIATLSRFGGTPSLPLEKVEPVVNRLRKLRPRVPTFDLSDQGERLALGSLIVKAAQTLKTPQAFLHHGEIVDAWEVHRKAFWATQPEEPVADPDFDWGAQEKKSLDECLIEMRNRHLIFQGHRWTCRECHHRNWVDLSELDSRMSCKICQHEIDAPITFEWLFRPNEFLIEGLRDHSVLSLLWVLSAFCDAARSSFIYGGPTTFWFDDTEGSPDAEADLLIVSDGTSYVCEVKSSWASVRKSDIESLASLALRLKPDVAMLAVMDHGQALTKAIDDATSALAASGIKLQLVTLSNTPLSDAPYLF